MEWNDDAADAVGRAPFFVRGMIRRRVEAYVRTSGRELVTLADVQELRAQTMGGGAPDLAMSNEQIEELVERTGTQVVSKSRFHEVKACGGAFGCPRALFDVGAIADEVARIIENSGIAEAVAARTEGPVLRHHKLCVSISGCPNSCSQPQIADFGLQGRARPALGTADCTQCGECVRVCREGSVDINSGRPAVERGLCIDCGDCAAVCPVQAIVTEQKGFSVLVGGKLGRHPQLARTLYDFTGEETALKSLSEVRRIFADELQAEERLADAVTRIGVDEIRRRVG